MSFWNDPLKVAADWLMSIFAGWGMPALAAQILIGFLGILILISLLMVLDIFLVWVERKVVSRFQDRIGPNRVGPFGLIQPFADIIKLLIKEDITPGGADRVVYNIAPMLSMMSVLILWAVVPLAPRIIGVDLNIGALYIIGAFRQVAVMVSFEIPMLTTLLIPTIFAGSMGFNAITAAQNIWFVWLAPLAAIIFLIAAIAELGRAPFDMAEGESELVAGYNTEYSGMKFGMFYAGELLHAFTFGGFWAILFFGGYRFLGLEKVSAFLAIAVIIFKAFLGYWFIMWVKYTLMRIRIDHMLGFNWKFLTPLSFTLLMVTALLNTLLRGTPSWLYASSMFLSNLVLGWIALELARAYSHRERKRVEGAKAEALAEAAQH